MHVRRAQGCMPCHRAKDFLRFLKKIDKIVVKNLDLHVVCVTTEPTRPRRLRLGSMPQPLPRILPRSRVSASGAASSGAVPDLEAAIELWVAIAAASPSLGWTTKARTILAKNAREMNKSEH